MLICIFVLMMTEWIDFPRSEQFLPDGKFVPGNNNSYDKCRRRFDLVSTIIQFISLVSILKFLFVSS